MPSLDVFKQKKKKIRKDRPGHFGSGEPAAVGSSPETYLKAASASHRESASDSHGLPTQAQIFNVAPNSTSTQNKGKGDESSEVPQKSPHPGGSAIGIANAQAKAHSVLGFGSPQGHEVAPLASGRISPTASGSHVSTVRAQSDGIPAVPPIGPINRFPDKASAFRNFLPWRAKTPQKSVAELPADEISQPILEDQPVVQVPAKAGSNLRMPPGELEAPNDDRLTYNQMQSLADPSIVGFGDYEHPEQISVNSALQPDDSLNSDANLGPHEDFDPNKCDEQAVVLKTKEYRIATEVGTIRKPIDMTHLRTSAGSRRLLLPGRQTSAARGEESIATQVQGWATSTSSYNIDPATDSLKLLTKQNAKLAEENRTLRFYKQRHDVIDKQMSEARIKIGSLAQMLKQNEKEGQRMRDGLERERMEYGQRVTALEKENHAAQRDLEMANNKHTAEVTRLKEEHRHGIIRLKQEKDSIAAKAQNDLDMANKKHAAEVFLLNGEHRRETDAITSKLQEMSIKTQKMQATIDEKRRTIAAQDIRMASYNKQIHGVISDSELEQKFKGLFLMFDSLFEAVPRPQTYVVDTAFDPNDFLGRNSSRGSRVWHKFLRKVCWDVLMRGFFQRQPGFGSFGCQGEGYLTLLHLYGLFAKSNGQDPSGPRVNFPNDKITNGWRASLFEAILRKVTSTVKDRTVTGFSAFFRENVKIVMDDLEETLQKVCQGALDSRVSEIILRLCNEAGILSLQMGAQQRVIVLETCYHQDWVQSGAVFQDDNRYNEDELQVDIMVQPSLKRIGDGRQDLATEKVLVIGHIVSLKAQGGV